MGDAQLAPITLEQMRAIDIVTRRLFNKDHRVQVWIVMEGDVTAENPTPRAVAWNVRIHSPAGVLDGAGLNVLDAYCNAIRSVQRT